MMGTSIKLSDLNEFISCPVCHGYLIDATTVNECLHTFCKSCIVKHIKNTNNECPKCNTIIHERRPLDYIVQDRNKQDIVYKLVPQLYISELNRKYSLQELPDFDSLSKLILKKNFIYVVLVQRKRNSPIDPTLSSTFSTNDPANKQANSIYLRCPINIKISHLRKLLVMKFQLKAHDKYEISRVIKSIEQRNLTSSYESASTSSSSVGFVSTTTTTATIATSTDDYSGDEMSIDEQHTVEYNNK